jgi:hypothetical protein
MNAILLGLYPVHVKKHVSLNLCWKIVSTDSLDDILDDEIQLALADQSVSKAYKIIWNSEHKYKYALMSRIRNFFCSRPYIMQSMPSSPS